MENKLFEYILDGLNVSRPKATKSSTSLPEKKSPFKKNTFLDLSSHHLTDFRAIQHSHLNDIRYLYLKNNQLRSLDPETFKVFQNLVWLDLRNNELSTFPSSIIYSPNITTILLENNNLHELPVEIGSLKYLKSVSLRGNPLLSPLREIIENGPRKTTDFLKNRWYEHSGTLPSPEDEDDAECNKKRKTISHVRRKLSSGDTQKSMDSVSSMWSDEIRVAMEQQEKYLQKKRDVESMKEWRKKYAATPKVGSKDQPPFDMDERYLKIMSRDDINKPAARSPTRVRPKQQKKRNIDEEFNDIQKSLFEIRTTNLKVPVSSEEMEKMKNIKGTEISKLRELQRRLEDLKLKY